MAQKWSLSLLLLSLLLTPVAVLADDPQLEVVDARVPDAVSEGVRAALNPSAYKVSVDGEVSATFWLRPELTAAANPSSELGVSFGKIKSGSLVGVVELSQPWSDYKGNSIQPGVYTLRYGIMPADGNHMGVAVYRDFLLLVPPDTDTNPEENFDFAKLIVSSGQATGVPHPGVLALFPIWDEIDGPSLVRNEMDQWTFAIKIGSQVLGLVVVGHGEV